MTYAELWKTLTEAEARSDDETLPADVRERSRETATLCAEHMFREGLTRAALERLAAVKSTAGMSAYR